MQPIRFALITSSSCELAKSFTLVDGKPVSSAIAHMTRGHAKIVSISNLPELRDVLDMLEPHQAITAGVPIAGDSPLTTRAGSEFNPDAVARTNENFRYLDTPSLFVIDVDTDTGVYRSVGEVLDALEAASPWLRQTLRVARPSASSYVGERGLRGVHVYVAVTRGTDILPLSKRLQIDQWAKGAGRVVISKSGALLIRQLSDASMYQPSRLMFEAPPVLGEGVTRKVPTDDAWLERAAEHTGRPAKYRTPEGWLDVQQMDPVKDIEQKRFDAALRQARNAKRLEAKRVALDYQRNNALAAGRDDGGVMGVRALRMLGDKIMPLSWPVVFDFDGKIERGTVQDALGALDVVMGRRCADPLDATRTDLSASDMRGAEVCTMRGKPGIWSHKLCDFFAFGESDTVELSHPLELAAERLCGTIEEWPDRADKKRASVVNLVFAVKLLAREAQIPLQFDVCSETHVETDVPSAGMWLDAVTRLGASNVSPGALDTAIDTVARSNPVDPWKDTILSLPVWDKVPRLDTVFTDLFGAPGSAAQTGAAQLFFAGIVMRQLRPGAPVPVVPVLIGDQRLGKGRFGQLMCEALGWPLPAEISFTPDERKMSMAAARGPIAELAEMSGLRKRDAEEVKRWTTDTQDVYRTPYGKREEAHPRRFVLFGTANKHELNNDETGNSRFMPILCETKAPANWTIELAQILAEAKARFCGTWEAYTQLLIDVPELVKAHNAGDMREGRGTVKSDLDDLLPPILIKGLGEGKSVSSAAIRSALDATPSGRRYDARAVSAWLKTRNWSQGVDGRGMRTYRPPTDWAQDDGVVVELNPFTKQAK